MVNQDFSASAPLTLGAGVVFVVMDLPGTVGVLAVPLVSLPTRY